MYVHICIWKTKLKQTFNNVNEIIKKTCLYSAFWFASIWSLRSLHLSFGVLLGGNCFTLNFLSHTPQQPFRGRYLCITMPSQAQHYHLRYKWGKHQSDSDVASDAVNQPLTQTGQKALKYLTEIAFSSKTSHHNTTQSQAYVNLDKFWKAFMYSKAFII